MGDADDNVTRAMTDAFVSRLGPGALETVRVVPGLPHGGAVWTRA